MDTRHENVAIVTGLRLWKAAHVVNLDYLPAFIDFVEHAVPPGPQTP